MTMTIAAALVLLLLLLSLLCERGCSPAVAGKRTTVHRPCYLPGTVKFSLPSFFKHIRTFDEEGKKKRGVLSFTPFL